MKTVTERRSIPATNGIRDNALGLEVFSTCPQSKDGDPMAYRRQVENVARWSEQIGCRGILVYTDNGLVDPWMVSQVILDSTDVLCPLVAVQPIYMHPYTVAKMISTYGFLNGRRIYMNMVAGGFRNDLLALDDQTPHDSRYGRIVEYTCIIRKLLEGAEPLTFEGDFYKVKNLSMTPTLAPELFPGLLMSGSSPAGQAAAKAIGATPVEYPLPPNECAQEVDALGRQRGLRVGIIARENSDEAWKVAHERFPVDRRGQIAHDLALKMSDSSWHKTLSDAADEMDDKRQPYWLVPFKNYKTFCPYLVGSYEEVAEELNNYLAADYRSFILDIPPNQEELEHIGVVFADACQRFQA